MQNSKLGLDFTKVAHAKDVARKIADDVQNSWNNTLPLPLSVRYAVCSVLTGLTLTPCPYPTCW